MLPLLKKLYGCIPHLVPSVVGFAHLYPLPTQKLIVCIKQAAYDDVIPLGEPIVTATGETVSELVIAKGTAVQCSVFQLNLSEELWGPDSREFKPERWLDDQLLPGAKSIQGYHHILTFADGPRFCLGRNFALANFKVRLFFSRATQRIDNSPTIWHFRQLYRL